MLLWLFVFPVLHALFLSLLPVFLLSTLSFYWFLRLIYYTLRKLTFCVLDFYCCVTNYHKLGGLKQQEFYYLTVSVGQTSGYSLPGFPASGSRQVAVQTVAEAVGSLEAELRRHFPAPMGFWQFIFLWLLDWGISFLPGSPLGSYRLPTLPCHVGFSSLANSFTAVYFFQASEESLQHFCLQDRVFQISKQNHSIAMSWWLKKSRSFCPHFRAGNFTKAWTRPCWSSGDTTESVHHDLPYIFQIVSSFSNFYLFGSFLL